MSVLVHRMSVLVHRMSVLLHRMSVLLHRILVLPLPALESSLHRLPRRRVQGHSPLAGSNRGSLTVLRFMFIHRTASRHGIDLHLIRSQQLSHLRLTLWRHLRHTRPSVQLLPITRKPHSWNVIRHTRLSVQILPITHRHHSWNVITWSCHRLHNPLTRSTTHTRITLTRLKAIE
jgi:hypothetical protein